MFKFLDKDNSLLRINEVDKLACDFWHVTEQKDEYARPSEKPDISTVEKFKENRKEYFDWMTEPNWFDMIGHAVEDLQYYITKRDVDGKTVTNYLQSIKGDNNPVFDMGIVAKQMVFNLTSAKSFESMNASLQWMKPYIDFCFYLKKQGVTAVGMGW